MTHTPGPWYVNGDCIEVDGPEGPRDVTLAVVLQEDNLAADARLIAAAPELLEALIKMRYTFTSDGTDDQHKACCMADAAIASAVISRREDR
jgi:hypothetical protein